MKILLNVLLACAFAALPATAQTSTQSPDQTQSQGNQSKSSMESAGSATKDAAKDAGSATKSGTLAATDKVTRKIDINSASKDDLMKLEGVGEATSDKIVAGRPYRSKRELLTRDIVNRSTYDKISGRIVAHSNTAKPSAAASNADRK
jgi:DNA uptake protein ComE-like DNA-binding protein